MVSSYSGTNSQPVDYSTSWQIALASLDSVASEIEKENQNKMPNTNQNWSLVTLNHSEMRGGNPAPRIEWFLDGKNITKEVSWLIS